MKPFLAAAGVALCLVLNAPAGLAQETASAAPSSAAQLTEPLPLRPEYKAVQARLAQGWNTWDVNSVTTQVLLPQGLAVHLALKHNTTENSEALLTDALIGRLSPGAEQVTPGPHAWNGSYTDLRLTWKNHTLRIQSAHDGPDLVLLVTPLPSPSPTQEPLPPTLIASINFLWNRPGTVAKVPGAIETHAPTGDLRFFCTCDQPDNSSHPVPNISPIAGPYFAADLTSSIAISSGHPRTVAEVQAILTHQLGLYQSSLAINKATQPISDAIQTTLGWDTIYEPEKARVFSPVSRVWSVNWGGYVLFDWDTFFAATMASLGDRDLACADAVETLRESTPEGFVPNYARPGNWKSFDRSEPPVGSITILALYQKFGDRWLLDQTFPALLNWNRWWSKHRDIDGYLTWGSDADNPPGNLDDATRGTRAGAILESGLDNSPMYDDTTFDPRTHLLQFADVGLMSLYVADCDALATIADTLHHTVEAKELRERSTRYKRQLQNLWSPEAGIFLNKDLRTGHFSPRLSPTNFYPLLAHAATTAQARQMIDKHLLNPDEFAGEWILPAIARNDPAFKDQNYWRGRIWGPMNFLVYLGLRNYNVPEARRQLATKSYALFLREWQQNGHVHENYNALLGTGDDVSNSDRFYHWGALLGYIAYLEQTKPTTSANP